MTRFEFVSVLFSIILGLGLTHLLRGLGQAFYTRHTNQMDPVHIAWTITTFIIIVLNWWVILLWRDLEVWSFTMFFVMILWTTSIYALALALYPGNLGEDVNYRVLFEENRTWFLSTFVLMCLLDLTVSTMRDGAIPEPEYLAFVGHYAVIGIIGIVFRNRRYDMFAAWYLAITMAAWSFGVRNIIG